ncbi:MAG: lysylphosphatidylglycerol synthase domain-containing protein, partial [Candidatus Omnitrophota bacterium]
MRRILFFFIRIVISAAVLFFLFKRVDLSKSIQIIQNINKPVLIFVLFLSLLNYAIGFFRWKILLTGLGLNIERFLILRSFCIGFFSNLFFPSAIGGDVFRSVDLG